MSASDNSTTVFPYDFHIGIIVHLHTGVLL
jgi:hypothetical protein